MPSIPINIADHVGRTPMVRFARLAGDAGVRGNGHGMMLEKNNREALQPILDWLKKRL